MNRAAHLLLAAAAMSGEDFPATLRKALSNLDSHQKTSEAPSPEDTKSLQKAQAKRERREQKRLRNQKI